MVVPRKEMIGIQMANGAGFRGAVVGS